MKFALQWLVSAIVPIVWCVFELDIQEIFSSNSFCRIPMKKGVLNGMLRGQVFLRNPAFRDMIHALYRDDAVLDSFLGGITTANASILAAFLNIPTSPLCITLLRNPEAPYSKLRAAMLEGNGNSTQIAEKQKIAQFLIHFFNDDQIIAQIKELFATIRELVEFKYPSIWGTWGGFNFLQLNELRKQPASPHTLVEASIRMLPKYVAFYVKYLSNIPKSSPSLFFQFMYYLNKHTPYTNGLWRMLLLKKDGYFAKLVLRDFQRLVQQQNPLIFATEAISAFLSPEATNDLIEVAKKTATEERLSKCLCGIDSAIYLESNLLYIEYEDDYLLKIKFLEIFSWNPSFRPASMVEMLAAISTYKIESLGLRCQSQYNLKMNSLNTIFLTIFKESFKAEKFEPINFYLKACLISVFFFKRGQSVANKPGSLEERIHTILGYIMEPFGKRKIEDIKKLILARFVQLLADLELNAEDESWEYNDEEMGMQVPVSAKRLEEYVIYLKGKTPDEKKETINK